MSSIDAILDEVEREIGDELFVESTALLRLGIYGSRSALILAIRNGTIPAIRVSQNRFVVHRSAILELLREGICQR